MDIRGKAVLITGASDGIGAALAGVLRKRGARLALAGRSEEKLQRVAAQGELTLAGDLCDGRTPADAVSRAAEHFGGLDILINNAGVGLYAPSSKAPLDVVRRMFDLNLFAALEMTQLALPHMAGRGGGMIVNVGSIAGRIPLPWFSMYCASKYALGAFTDALRIELKDSGVRAMTVCPGYVKTGFQDHVLAGNPPDSIRRGRAFAISPERCAEDIARGIERDARTVMTPRVGWLLIGMYRLVPSVLDRRLHRMYLDLERQGFK